MDVNNNKELGIKMKNQREIFRGEIYWVKLDVKEFSSIQGNLRPCVVCQNNIGNKYSPTTIIAPISSKVNKAKRQPTHVYIGEECGVKMDSVILLEQIQTIDKKDLGDYIGRLTPEKIIELDKALAISGGINLVSNPIDLEHIEDLLWLINDSTDKAIRFNNNEYHIRVRETLIKELKYYCNSCGINFERRVQNRIKELSIRERNDVQYYKSGMAMYG
jgi:mRNA interferase MazF